jgi:CheY-like chemotaxis protein
MALSAAEALRHCDAQRPRVVVTDLSMPNLDGLGLAEWMHLRFPSVPLILMTGQFLDPSTRTALARIFTAVMPKPVDVEQLLGRLERLMPPRLIAEPTLTTPIRSPYHAMV